MLGIDRTDAKAILESLRFGTPPIGHVREFTVGRQHELDQLEETISRAAAGRGSGLLVRANYGGGKSHLLRIVRERALEAGYAVSLVVTDAMGGVRFNRMDTIFGAVTREVEVPGRSEKGIRTLFDAFRQRFTSSPSKDRLMQNLSANGHWSQKGQLSDPILIGLRAWVLGTELQRSLVEEWYAWPEPYRNRRKDLYWGLIADIEHRFEDPRSESGYYIDKALAFHNDAHTNAWNALGDLHAVAVAAGLKGLVLMFDEFEDVVQNLQNRDYQVAAFENLFIFFAGTTYPGMAYFAVTPDFAKVCREELLARGVHGFPVSRFSKLPAFELPTLTEQDFIELAGRIAMVHGLAGGWRSEGYAAAESWDEQVRAAWGRPAPDRIREAIQRVVRMLDAASRLRPGES